MNFIDRLKNYRLYTLRLNTKKEMADKLDVSQQWYAMVERGDRKPSDDFMNRLVKLSMKPEEYWLYGVETDEEYFAIRKEFKSLKKTLKQLEEIGLINEGIIDDDAIPVLIKALRLDVEAIYEKSISLKKENQSDENNYG